MKNTATVKTKTEQAQNNQKLYTHANTTNKKRNETKRTETKKKTATGTQSKHKGIKICTR